MDRLFAIPAERLLPILLLFICISYSNSIHSTAIVLDDTASFIEVANVYVDDFSAESLTKLSSTRFGRNRFIPMLTFAADNYLAKRMAVSSEQYTSERHRLRLKIAHLTNIIIHLLATLALFFFLKGLLQTEVGRRSLTFIGSPGGYGLIVCALWAFNPVQTNVVTYLVQRMASLAALFYLASLAFYIQARHRSLRWRGFLCWLGCLATALAAFGSKENSVTLPVAMLLVEFIFISPGLGESCRRYMGRRKWYQLAFMVIAVIFVLPLFYHFVLNFTGGYGHRHFSLSERLFTELRIVVFYISLLVLPLPGRLNLEHDFTLSHGWLAPPATLLSFVLLGALLLIAFRVRKCSPLITFGIFWFFLNLAVESTVISLELIFEHRLYLPAVGFFIALAGVIDHFCGRVRRPAPGELKKILALTVVSVAAAFSVLTAVRNNDWRDNYTLYLDSNEKSPAKPRTYVNLGSALGRLGRYDEAIEVLERGIALGRDGYEGNVTAVNNILICYINQHRVQDAINRGESFLARMTPAMNKADFHKFMYNLGRSYYLAERYDEALEAFVTGLRYNRPNDYMLPGAIEKLLLDAAGSEKGRQQLGLTGESMEVPLLVAEIMRRVRRYDFGQFYLKKAEMEDGTNELLLRYRQQYQQEIDRNRLAAVRADINNDRLYQENRRFRYLMKLAGTIADSYPPLGGKPLQLLLVQALRLGPDNVFAGLYLGRFYAEQGRCQDSVRILEHVVAVQPEFVPALELLGSCYLRMERYEDTLAAFQKLLAVNPGHHRWFAIEEFMQSWQQGRAATGEVE